jgi:lipoprotein-releasing system permease protein
MTPNPDPKRVPAVPRRGWVVRIRGALGGQYKFFVAWRYLLNMVRKIPQGTGMLLFFGLSALALIALLRAVGLDPEPRYLRNWMWDAEIAALLFVVVVEFRRVLPHSKPSLILGVIGIVVFVPSLAGYIALDHDLLPKLHLDPERLQDLIRGLRGAAVVSGLIVGISMLFGTLRAYYTFFTTVPIGGVWIGTSALVIVLSVMGGFETDLREKILGSNAHIQITREDGDFLNWREVKARIDQMPGVVASTPFAVSEVVIAANNTPTNVIIKGIDPNSVGKVTDLVHDLEDRDAMSRLEPMIKDTHDLRVPQKPRSGDVVDPPPDDLPPAGDPIDFSAPEPSPAAPAAGSGAGFGGDAVRVLGEDLPPPPPPPPPAKHGGRAISGASPLAGSNATGPSDAPDAPVIDPPPRDLVTSDEPPTDYSRPDYLQDAVKVIDPPFDSPSISRRTQSLPGILVGRELVKQTHMYTGEEVRVVSPLSDPANPDANGTPIPFNRDYRVAGTFFTGMYEYDLKYVYVTLGSLQAFLDRGDAIDGIEVRVTNPYDSDAFVAHFQSEFGPAYRVQDWKELNRSLFSALKLEKIAMFLVLGIVILVASFSIVGNLIMVVVEKAREIALLKTLGASDVGVMMLFAIQGLMIGLIGTVLGVATGLLGCWGLSEFGFPLNENVYYIDRLPVHVDPQSVAAAAAAGVLISIAATLYPAVVAARVRPAAGMRH